MSKLKALFARLSGLITPESRRIAIYAFVGGFLALFLALLANTVVLWSVRPPDVPLTCIWGESGLAWTCEVRWLFGGAK